MDVNLPKPEKYVVAVSGGVDSMVLLDILSKQPDLELVVAHLDHGIRTDSSEDMRLVQQVADTLRVPCVCQSVNLGSDTSEAEAREVRYKFLRKVLKETRSKAIITAHHQDDLIETAILNMLRGTGRKGLSSMAGGQKGDIVRPLLNVTKEEIKDYASKNKIEWREDSTNSDDKYLRNHVRLNILPRFSETDKSRLLDLLLKAQKNNIELDTLLAKDLSSHSDINILDKQWFNNLPHKVALEFLASWLRLNNIRSFDSKMLERLVVASKTASVGKAFPVLSGYQMQVTKDNLALTQSER